MATLPDLYTTRMDVKPESNEYHMRWCNTRHMPDLMEAGFFSAVRYQSLDGPQKYLQVYEIPGLDIFQTDGYKYICRCDPECNSSACLNKADPAHPTGPQMGPHGSGSTRSVYRQLVTVDVADPPSTPPGRTTDSIGSIKGSTIFTIRFNMPPDVAEEFVPWMQNNKLADVLGIPGFNSGRFTRRIDEFSTDEPMFMEIFELDGPDAVKGLSQMKLDAESQRFVDAVTDRKMNLMQRFYPTE